MAITIDSKGWAKEAIGIYYGADSFGMFEIGQPKWIVLHGTAWPNGKAITIAQTWADEVDAGKLGASTHFIIDKDGTFTQGISILDTAAGNSGAPDSYRETYLPSGNLNMCTISIECCKYDIHDMDELTPQQNVTLFDLCDAICTFSGIQRHVVTIEDVSNGGIIRHRDCDLKYRSNCPGPMPFEALQYHLNRGVIMFTNQNCVEVWNSSGFGQDDSSRGSGLFDYWRSQWKDHKNFQGAPSSKEYPFTLADGTKSVARNHGSFTNVWNNANPYTVQG